MGHPSFTGFFKRECQRRDPKSSGVLWFPCCFPFTPRFVFFVKESTSIGKRTWPSLLKGNLKELQLHTGFWRTKNPHTFHCQDATADTLKQPSHSKPLWFQGVLKLADFGLAREFVDLQMLGFF